MHMLLLLSRGTASGESSPRIWQSCQPTGSCPCVTADMSALWGKLGADILLQSFEAAREDINRLKEAIDNNTFAPPLVQLQQRTWLLHWSLFVFWNHEKGKDVSGQHTRWCRCRET